jgi:hypothetical protein
MVEVQERRCRSITAEAAAATTTKRKREGKGKRQNKTWHEEKRVNDDVNDIHGPNDMTEQRQRIFKSKLVRSIREATSTSSIREYEVNDMKRQGLWDVF